MIHILSIPGALRIAWTLVHFLWQGLVLGLLAWGILALMRRQRAQLRYLVACGFLVACLLAPVVTFLRMAPPAVSAMSSASSPMLGQAAFTSEWISLFRGEQTPQVSAWVVSLRGRLLPLLPWILGFWMTGVGFFSIRSVGGWIWLQRMKAEGTPILEEYWLDRLEQMTHGAGIRRVVRFLESDRIESPLATGLLRPLIMVPLGFFASLDPVAVEAVLAHELAHIRRLDVLVNGLQCVIETLLFFHPAVWWLSRRIRIEREHCCDDAAVQACGDPVLFAETLNRLDTLRGVHATLVPGATGGSLMERMRRLLVPDPPPLRFTAPSLSMVVALCLGVTVLAAQQETVQKTLRELPARLMGVGEVTLHRAEEKAATTAQALAQFAPQPGDAPDASKVAPVLTPAREHAIPPLPHATLEPVPAALPVTSAPPEACVPVLPVVIQEESPALTRAPEKPAAPMALVEIVATDRKAEPGNAFWPEGVPSVVASSLPFSSNPPNFDGKGEVNAYRILRVLLQPGEQAQFKMQAEDSKVVMEARVPHAISSLDWRMALQNANFPPRQSRSGRFEIKNPTKEAQVLDLIVYGVHGYAYRIDLTRTPGAATGK